MKLYVKNMVCSRCKMVVRTELEKLGLQPISVELGEIELKEKPAAETLQKLNDVFRELGFELIDNRKSRIIEKIKTLLVELVQHEAADQQINVSEYLARQLHYDYSYLSNLFSEVEGTTIEKYLITQKIEKAKELLVYDELSLSEIAFILGYSSVAHLSAQFKKFTGLTPTFYKSMGDHKRRNIEDL